ncbi:hypothetical protein JHK86_001870 [Glycine max]|nr:hypothetical protein JHK86_001870 [Glycine max]
MPGYMLEKTIESVDTRGRTKAVSHHLATRLDPTMSSPHFSVLDGPIPGLAATEFPFIDPAQSTFFHFCPFFFFSNDLKLRDLSMSPPELYSTVKSLCSSGHGMPF